MIIKSMSRKVPSFNQLIGYMDLGASSRENNIYYNLYSRKADAIENEFNQNSEYIQKRKNGVYMYHEVISITRSKQIDEQEQIEILRQVVYKYIQERAGNNLVYAVLHDDKVDNLHYHLLISSNQIESSKKHRLSKVQFDTVKKNLELFVLDCHPELEQKKLISKEKESQSDSEENSSQLSNKAAELKRRTGKTPQRDIVKESLLNIFASASTQEEFIELLESEHYQIYKRGKYWGILNETTNRKHRFSTLGVSQEFEALEQRLASLHNATSQAKEAKQESKHQTADKPKDEGIHDTVTDTKEQVSETVTNKPKDSNKQQQSKTDTVDKEAEKRQAEMKNMRKKKAEKKFNFKKKQ